jgi:hypothetical protein
MSVRVWLVYILINFMNFKINNYIPLEIQSTNVWKNKFKT